MSACLCGRLLNDVLLHTFNMDASFVNWFILINQCRCSLAILMTLTETSDDITQKEMRKHVSQDAVCNKNRMAVEPILQSSSPSFTTFLETLGAVVHNLVPERLKSTEENNVGMFPHPVDVATNVNG